MSERDPRKPFCEGGASGCEYCVGSCGREEWLLENEDEETLSLARTAPKYPQFDVRLPVVCFDFDGVLASAKWPKPEIGESDPVAKEAVEHYASRGCEVIVCSARPSSHHPRIWDWLDEQGLSWAIYDVTNIKPVASLYFDDRAVRWPLV